MMNRRGFMRAGLITLAAVTGLASASIRLPEAREKLCYEPGAKTIVFDEYSDLKAGWWPPLPLILPKNGDPYFYQTKRSVVRPVAVAEYQCEPQTVEKRRWRAIPLRDGRRPNWRGFRWELQP